MKKQFVKLALTVNDLSRAVDSGSDSRAGECSSNLFKFDIEDATAYFASSCARSANTWHQMVQFLDFNYIIPEEERAEMPSSMQIQTLLQKYPDIMNSNVLVFCSCPAFRYYFSYINTELDTALSPETRYPEIRNPNLEGTVCKHLISVFRSFF